MAPIFKLSRLFKLFLLTNFLLILMSCDNIGMNEQQMLQKAKDYLDKGELMAASIELRNTLQKNSNNAEARYILGSISLQVGDLASAEKEFRRAAMEGWSKEDTQIGLARIFIPRKEFQKLLDEIVVIDTWSNDTRANASALRALANAGLGHTTQARTILDEGRAYRKNTLYVLTTTALFQFSGIQHGDASQTLKSAISLYPNNTEILLLSAHSYIQNNKLAQAADTFRKIISLEPPILITANGRIAFIRLAHLQINEKKYDEANATLDQLLRRNNNDPEAIYLVGLLAFSQGNYHRAEEHIRVLLTTAPDNSRSQLLMGKIKYALKDFDQAAHHLSTYLKTRPSDIATHKLLTNTYIILNQPEQARLTLQTALNTNPDDTTTQVLLSQIEFNTGDMDAGIQALKKAIKYSPDSIALHKKLTQAYITIGETEQALSELKIIQNLGKVTQETQKLAISAYLKAGEIKKAISVANKMLEKNPHDPAVLSLNGNLHAAGGDQQQARTYFNKALTLQNNLPSATIGLARIETGDGNLDKAVELYSSLVESDKGGTTPMLALSKLAARQNRIKDMLSWLEKARTTHPTEIKSHIILANYYLSINQPSKANIYIQEAIKISPKNVDLLALHGKVLIAQKSYKEALLPLNKLINKAPDSTTARILLSEAFIHLGMTKEARQQLLTALKKQENNYLAISLLAQTEIKAGNQDKSLEYAKKLQKIMPKLYLGYMHEGDVLMIKQEYNKARYAYNNAWKHKQTAELAKRLFTASRHNANFKDAIKPVQAWLNDHPGDTSLRFFLAVQYQNTGQNESAIREYEKIIEETLVDTNVLNNLAWLYHLKADPKALDLAERAYRADPENAGIQDTYGWILTHKNQAGKGKRLIKQAMEKMPSNLEIRYHYAIALIKSGNENKGQRILEELLKQDKPFNGRNEAQQIFRKLKTST